MEGNCPSLGTLREACEQNQQAKSLAWNLSRGEKWKKKTKPQAKKTKTEHQKTNETNNHPTQKKPKLHQENK